MMSSLISDMMIQRYISKDIKCIRFLNRDLGINGVLNKIDNYYIDKNYSEDVLFGRSSKLKAGSYLLNNIYGGGIGGLIGLVIGFINTKDIIKNYDSSVLSIARFVLIIFFSIGLILMLYLILFLLTKVIYGKIKMYDYYFYEKELDIIERMIGATHN